MYQKLEQVSIILYIFYIHTYIYIYLNIYIWVFIWIDLLLSSILKCIHVSYVSCILQVQKHPASVCLSICHPSREGVSRTALHDHSMHSTARSVASLGPWQPWHDWIWWKTHRPRGVYIFDIWCTPRGPHGLQRNQPYFCCHNHLRLTGLNCCLRWYLFPTALWLKSSLSHWASSIYTYFLYWVTPSYSLPRPNCDLPLSKAKALQAKGDGSKPDPTNEGSASYDTILRCNELCMKLNLEDFSQRAVKKEF